MRHAFLRESPKAFTTTLFWKRNKGTQVIPVPNGKKVKDVDIFLNGQSAVWLPKCIIDKHMEAIQRLHGCGLESLINSMIA